MFGHYPGTLIDLEQFSDAPNETHMFESVVSAERETSRVLFLEETVLPGAPTHFWNWEGELKSTSRRVVQPSELSRRIIGNTSNRDSETSMWGTTTQAASFVEADEH